MHTATPFAHLLATPDPPELGPEKRVGVEPEEALKKKLASAFRASNLGPTAQELIFALILLWHDHIDAAHEISQRIETADASFIHGIVHRREPDYGNAKYWFGRAGTHPCFPELARRVRARLDQNGERALSSKLLPDGQWSAKAFIDACSEASRTPDSPNARVLRDLQHCEFEVLLEHLAEIH